MGFYSRRVFPWLCDLALRAPAVAELRQRLLADARGEILEIGFGTGLNLPHYPKQVRRITVVEPNPGMHRRARARIEQSGIEVDQRLAQSEQLPLAGASFDTVVSTFTLCSIEQVDLALGQLYSVLRPGGRFLYLEHGLSPDAQVQTWQRRLNWLQTNLADNCHLDRNIRQLISNQPFSSIEASEFYLEQTPPTHGYLYQGIAVK